MLKLVGYLISSLSVICLGIVSWSGAAGKPLMLALLIAGMATSILGMAIRFWSYLREKREREAQTLISK
ncbi:MAG: hypothetical protein JWQ29_3003 [Phenylobacterium sp.]|nr:hypothetical protein [Phenylobacterium sp.]